MNAGFATSASEPLPNQLGGDISAGQAQRSRGTTAEEGPAHPDDTCRGVLQQGQRAGIADRCQPSRFRRDSPEFDCYVPLSRFTNLFSRFLSSAVSAVQQLDI